MTIAITRLDLSAADLRDAARRTRDAKAARRMIAIALVLEGWSRGPAAGGAGAMDRQTLCDWVHRYNELGLSGLFRHGRVAMARRHACQPNSKPRWRHGWSRVRHSRGIAWYVGAVSDLQRRIAQEFAVQLHERTVGKLLRKLSFRRLSVHPPAPTEQARGTGGFQRSFADLMTAALPAEAAGRPVEIWFTDEARVGQQGTLTRVWAKRAPARVPHAIDALSGPICSARSVRSAAPVPPSSCQRSMSRR